MGGYDMNDLLGKVPRTSFYFDAKSLYYAWRCKEDVGLYKLQLTLLMETITVFNLSRYKYHYSS